MQKKVLSTEIHNNHLVALCALSNAPKTITPDLITKLIFEAPDPETATRHVLEHVSTYSDALQSKWRKIVFNLWSTEHAHVPSLLNLPITTEDVSDVAVLQDAIAFLRVIQDKPATMAQESNEWLLSPADVHHLVQNIPSLQHNLPLQIENEWQILRLRRLRSVLQSLRLVRRYKDKLVIVKCHHQRFMQLPAIHQFYLLWHTEAYHVDWSEFSAIWGEYLSVIQDYLPLLWEVSSANQPHLPYDIRQWNQNLWNAFNPLWEQAGLLNQPPRQEILFSLIRLHSLPTAVTQVIMRDLFERYGLVCGEGELFAWTNLGVELIKAESTREMPCSLDLIK